MKLFEFFSKNLDIKPSEQEKSREFDKDELFFYILDNDDLHKKHFFKNAKRLKKADECPREMMLECWMPMVEEGCQRFSEKKKLFGSFKKLFDQDLRENLCERLHEHYFEDIKKGVYEIKEW